MARENWVTILGADWRQAYDGEPPWGQIGKHLKPLMEKPFSEVQIHWRHYLKETPARFASPARFAATFGAWAPPSRSPIVMPRTTKYVEIRENGRARMIEVPLNDPRPEL